MRLDPVGGACHNPGMDNAAPLPAEYRAGVGLSLFLSVITCGAYGLYWNYTLFRAMNRLLGREEFDFVKWFLLCIITCGLYNAYYQYKIGSELQAYLAQRNEPGVTSNLALMGLVLALFKLSIIDHAVFQYELNRLCAP